MNNRKDALKTESQDLTMNEIAEKHFKYTELQKRQRILLMNETAVLAPAITKLLNTFSS
jgi:hypothetical protein